MVFAVGGNNMSSKYLIDSYKKSKKTNVCEMSPLELAGYYLLKYPGGTKLKLLEDIAESKIPQVIGYPAVKCIEMIGG